ncbi:ABC transporter ATP-binding protein, partial [Streptomyces sp. NEAU-H3]|nr:ABC transporter ATP-binding protein [Streptomyces sp. NEAU-H3]
ADHADPARLGELAHENGLVLHELSPQSASLEDAFMQLTAQTVEYHAHTGAGPAAVPPGAAPPPPGGVQGWGENQDRKGN